MDYSLSEVMQQSLLCLLCMDDENAPIIRNTVPEQSFDGIIGEMAVAVYKHIDKFKKAPKSDLDDVLDEYIGLDRADRKFRRIERIVKNIHVMWGDGPNKEMIMGRLEKRVRAWKIKTATKDLLTIFNEGREDDESLDRMEQILNSAVRDKMEAFDPGLSLSDIGGSVSDLFRDRSEEVFLTGIKQLDDYKLGPKRAALHMFLGLAKTGKTRWLIQVGRYGLLQGAKVLHVSLEMHQKEMRELYMQSWFGFTEDRREVIYRSKLIKDEKGRLLKIRRLKAKIRLALDDRGAKRIIKARLERKKRRFANLKIKSFPTKQLTFDQLVAYIDRLEIQEGFIPDIVIVDYPKLMKFSTSDLRVGLGEMVERLRGLAVERNCAVVVPAQLRRLSKRDGEDSGSVDAMDIGEDYSQIQTADTALVFRRSKMEKKLGLARILVDTARRGKSGWEILITQNYDQGKFCVDSVMMQSHYVDKIKEKSEMEDD